MFHENRWKRTFFGSIGEATENLNLFTSSRLLARKRVVIAILIVLRVLRCEKVEHN